MNNRIMRTVLAIVAVVGAVTALSASASANEVTPITSEEPVLAFAAPEETVGTSTLTRTEDGVAMGLRTTGAAPREALTVWWVVFNDPDACSAPGCGSDDIFVDGDPAGPLDEDQIAAADIVAAYATGRKSSNQGTASFRASLAENEAPGTREIIFGDGATLKDAAVAEVHLVVRSHGPAVAGQVDVQTGSFAGGCDVFLAPPAVPSAVGECADTLFSVHQP